MQLQPQHAVDWLVETLLDAEDQSITICPVGPLTNIGMALVREPAIASKIESIITMGGGYFVGGNVTPAAEFNIFVDPSLVPKKSFQDALRHSRTRPTYPRSVLEAAW